MKMTGRRIFQIIFVLLFCASPLLAADVNISNNLQITKNYADDDSFRQKRHEVPRTLRINENYDFYDIEGTIFAELKQQMRQKGTKWNDGKIYAALTTWDIRYKYEITEESGNCRIRSVVTDISAVYHLPNWTAVAAAAPELAGKWETYMKHLMEHEYGHKDISVKVAAEINQALAGLGSFSSKEELEKEAKRLVKAKLTRLRELQIAYDEETDHGLKQGVLLEASEPTLASLLPR
jgi:predicted secreted Zn-dependent protease